jgi:putative transposase
MKGASLLSLGTEVELNSTSATITSVHADYIVIQYRCGDTKMLRANQIIDLLSTGALQFVAPKESVVAIHLNEEELCEASVLEKLFIAMSNSVKPHSRDHLKDHIIPEVIRAQNINTAYVPCLTTLIEKHNKWLHNGQSVAGIVRKIAGNVRTPKFDQYSIDFMMDVAEKNFLKLNGRTKADTLNLYRQQVRKLPKGSVKEIKRSTFYTLLNNLDEYEVAVARKGRDYANNKFRTTHSKYITEFPGEIIEIDAVHVNVPITQDGKSIVAKKVILYFAIDVFTRLIVGYHCSLNDSGKNSPSENSDAVVELLKKVCIPSLNRHPNAIFLGKPKAVICDAGSAFNCGPVKQFLLNNQIENHITETAKPWKKPFIERFNRTLRDRFCRALPFYTDQQTTQIKKSDYCKLIKSLSKQDFIDSLEEFIYNIYHYSPHCGLRGLTPADNFKQNIRQEAPAIITVNIEKVMMFHGLEDTRVYSRNKGIAVNKLQYNTPELTEFMRGTKVRKVTISYSNSDVSSITVVHPSKTRRLEVTCTHPLVEKGMSKHESAKLTDKVSEIEVEEPQKTMPTRFNEKMAKQKPSKNKNEKMAINVKDTPVDIDSTLDSPVSGGRKTHPPLVKKSSGSGTGDTKTNKTPTPSYTPRKNWA